MVFERWVGCLFGGSLLVARLEARARKLVLKYELFVLIKKNVEFLKFVIN